MRPGALLQTASHQQIFKTAPTQRSQQSPTWHSPLEIKYCEDTRPQNQLSAAQEQLNASAAPSFKEPPLPSTPTFWEWVAPSTTIPHYTPLRSWVLSLKESRYLLPSFVYILSTTLPNLSIVPDAMLSVVSHLGAPPSGRVRCEANYTAGSSEALSPNHYCSDITNTI